MPKFKIDKLVAQKAKLDAKCAKMRRRIAKKKPIKSQEDDDARMWEEEDHIGLFVLEKTRLEKFIETNLLSTIKVWNSSVRLPTEWKHPGFFDAVQTVAVLGELGVYAQYTRSQKDDYCDPGTSPMFELSLLSEWSGDLNPVLVYVLDDIKQDDALRHSRTHCELVENESIGNFEGTIVIYMSNERTSLPPWLNEIVTRHRQNKDAVVFRTHT